jgi:hypothetical protein
MINQHPSSVKLIFPGVITLIGREVAGMEMVGLSLLQQILEVGMTSNLEELGLKTSLEDMGVLARRN